MNNAHKLITILGGKNTQLYVKITPIDSGDEGNLQTHLDLSAQAIGALEVERDEARAWARRMKRERDALRDLLGMMDIDKIAENLEKMRRWLK